MNEQLFRELSAARALHVLSPEEEQTFSEALAAHPEWLPVADEDRETVARLSASISEVAPPAGARTAMLDLIARTPQFEAPERPSALGAADLASVVDEPVHAPEATLPPELLGADDDHEDAEESFTRSRRRAGWFGLAASVAVLLAIALALPVTGMLAPKDPVSIALQQVESSNDARTETVALADGGQATLHWSNSSQQAVFVAEGMRAAPADRDYELWIVRGDEPISLGVMRANNAGGAAVLAQGFEPGDALAVTVEDRGGSRSGLPTTDPIAVIASA
ncbi:anti-sigma factor [Leucobacter japonicus]|uniref:anti-sigma factor n=1 Tax=Leucobacter japonicus TaxID=1461259 RepID=UPI0006A75C80|nr:anti-sigma factor [Leucobacter japonicus]